MSVSQISQALQKEYEPTCDLSVAAVKLLLQLIEHKEKINFEVIWQQSNRTSPAKLAATLDELISAGLIREVPDAITEIADGWNRTEFLQQSTGLSDDNCGAS